MKTLIRKKQKKICYANVSVQAPSKNTRDVYKDKLKELLHYRPFCKCALKEKDLYEAWVLRIIETLENG